VNMLVRDVGGEGQHIYALGTTEHEPGKRFEQDFGRIAGPAGGPERSARGDWAAFLNPLAFIPTYGTYAS
jgi:hypothetical protein